MYCINRDSACCNNAINRGCLVWEQDREEKDSGLHGHYEISRVMCILVHSSDNP